jgi:hypothetical protein
MLSQTGSRPSRAITALSGDRHTEIERGFAVRKKERAILGGVLIRAAHITTVKEISTCDKTIRVFSQKTSWMTGVAVIYFLINSP